MYSKKNRGCMMNILICSAGRRVKLVNYFKEELQKVGGEVIAVDCDASAPALQFADIAHIVPRITDPEYVSHIKQLCRTYNVHAVLSLIDPELSLLAEHKKEFEQENITMMVSDKDVVNICFDKYLTYKLLQTHGLPGIPTFLTLDEIAVEMEKKQLDFPLIIKPRNGSASIGISIVHSFEELHALWKDTGELIAQPFIDGNEFGVDCYIDLLTNQPINIFCKQKIKMRAGETDKSIAIHDPNLVQLIEELLCVLRPIGPIDIDCFKTDKGYMISEINPRFGGGYPHAHEEGQNFVKCIVNNLMGIPNKARIDSYSQGSVMIKYDDVVVLKSIDVIKEQGIFQRTVIE